MTPIRRAGVDYDPVKGVISLGKKLADPVRIIGRTMVIWKTRRSVCVSTVSIPSLDFESGEMYFWQWETLVIGETHLLPRPLDAVQFDDLHGSYSSEADARIGHRAWCRLVSGWLTSAGRHTVTLHEMTTWKEDPLW